MEDLKLNPTDNAILDRLAEGRATPSYIAQAEDYSRQNITNRLRRLEEHGVVDKIHTGLYELVRDPRESTAESNPDERREELTEAEPATVEELTANLDMRSFGREEEARREALRAVLRVLKEEGSASTSALKSAAWEAYQPDARPNEDTYPEVLNLWNNAIRTYGFDELDVVESGTEHERQGGYVWVGHE